MKITIETSNPNDSRIIAQLSKKRPQKLDLEAIKKEKNYQGVNRNKFNQLIKDLNITEPIDVLISQLGK